MMALVAYADSDSDLGSEATSPALRKSPKRRKGSHVADSNDFVNGKKPELPPLPSAFHDLYASNVRISAQDDPTLHGGRKRNTPHIEGNWNAHVYLEWHPTATEMTLLANLIAAVQDSVNSSNKDHFAPSSELHSLLLSPLSTPLPLHISLSRPLTLVSERRDLFLDKVTSHIRTGAGARIKHPFTVSIDVDEASNSAEGLRWVANADKSRWFLVLGVRQPEGNELNRLLAAANNAAKEMDLAPLYIEKPTPHEKAKHQGRPQRGGRRAKVGRGTSSTGPHNSTPKPSMPSVSVPAIPDCTTAFHISIAWSLAPPPGYKASAMSSHGGSCLPSDGNDHGLQTALDAVRKLRVEFAGVKIKIGNVVHAVDFAVRNADGSGGAGILG